MLMFLVPPVSLSDPTETNIESDSFGRKLMAGVFGVICSLAEKVKDSVVEKPKLIFKSGIDSDGKYIIGVHSSLEARKLIGGELLQKGKFKNKNFENEGDNKHPSIEKLKAANYVNYVLAQVAKENGGILKDNKGFGLIDVDYNFIFSDKDSANDFIDDIGDAFEKNELNLNNFSNIEQIKDNEFTDKASYSYKLFKNIEKNYEFPDFNGNILVISDECHACHDAATGEILNNLSKINGSKIVFDGGKYCGDYEQEYAQDPSNKNANLRRFVNLDTNQSIKEQMDKQSETGLADFGFVLVRNKLTKSDNKEWWSNNYFELSCLYENVIGVMNNESTAIFTSDYSLDEDLIISSIESFNARHTNLTFCPDGTIAQPVYDSTHTLQGVIVTRRDINKSILDNLIAFSKDKPFNQEKFEKVIVTPKCLDEGGQSFFQR